MAEWREELESQATRGDTPMKPQLVLRELDRLAPDGCHRRRRLRHLHHLGGALHADRRNPPLPDLRAVGTMGCALPYAVAAALAEPGRMVVAVIGDGALTMGLGELATCVRHRLNLKLLVLRNDTLGRGALGPDGVRRHPGIRLRPAAGGVRHGGARLRADRLHLDRPEECGEVMEQAMATPGPVLIEAIVDPNEPPMPPKATLQQSAHMAEALARGTPVRRRMSLTAGSDSVRKVL